MYPTTSCQSSGNAPNKDYNSLPCDWCKNKFQQCSLSPCYNGDKKPDWTKDPLALPLCFPSSAPCHSRSTLTRSPLTIAESAFVYSFGVKPQVYLITKAEYGLGNSLRCPGVPHLASSSLFRRVWFSCSFYIIFSGLMRMSRYPRAPQMFGQVNWALYSCIRQPKDGYKDLHEFQKLNRVHSILAAGTVTTRPQELA